MRSFTNFIIDITFPEISFDIRDLNNIDSGYTIDVPSKDNADRPVILTFDNFFGTKVEVTNAINDLKEIIGNLKYCEDGRGLSIKFVINDHDDFMNDQIKTMLRTEIGNDLCEISIGKPEFLDDTLGINYTDQNREEDVTIWDHLADTCTDPETGKVTPYAFKLLDIIGKHLMRYVEAHNLDDQVMM